MNYIDLHCHSTFSSAMTAGDAYGSPKEIVKRAVELGWSAVAITDHGWMGGAPSIYKAAKENGLKPILGCELYVTPDFAHGVRGKEVDGLTFHLTVLALSKEGYENLVAWSSEAMLRENYHRKPRISIFRMLEIAPHPLHHNVIMSGCLASELNRLISDMPEAAMAFGMSYIEEMKSVFPNFYIEIWDHYVKKFDDPDTFPAYVELLDREAVNREILMQLAKATGTPLVLTNDSHMQRTTDRQAHIALKAVSWKNRDDAHMGKSEGQVVSSFLKDYTYYGNYMRDMVKVAERGDIQQEALDSIAEIVEESNLVLDPLDNFTYSIPFSGYDDPVETIRKRCRKKLKALVKKHGQIAAERFDDELSAMGDFAHYLLLMADFIDAAHAQGILTWTRGSAANSFLCYVLGIHDIDSIEFELVFSRFFNPARKKLPDIDVDIQPDRYEDFIEQIVLPRMEELEGKGNVVQICNYGKAQNKAAFRQAATALGIPKEEQDKISKLLPSMIDSDVVEETDVFEILKVEYPEIYELTSSIFDTVKNVSQHACGWIFGTRDRPVSEWVPLYLIASSGKLVTQYDYKTIEDFGLTKMDFLRLKALTVIANALKLAGRSPMDFYDLPLDDEKTFEMIRSGNVEGIHTLQGKEVRKGIIEMQPETVHDLILAAALYRPANTRDTDGAKTYNLRRKGHEVPTYPHEIVEKVTQGTLGVPVFQEQAMEICYEIGFSHAEVDELYQAIKTAKGAGRGAKELFEKLAPKFLKRAKQAGMSKGERYASWEFVQAYQGYGFNKGHASSYGILADKMSYVKAHYPTEYYASLLDVFSDRPTYLAAARAEKFRFLPPCVNRSMAGFSIDRLVDKGIRVGISAVDGIGPVAAKAVLAGQTYTDLDDFKSRTDRRSVNVSRIENLSAVGALETLGIPARDEADITQFHLLGFTLEKPKAFKGCKPKHVAPRESSGGWRHLGRERGVEPIEGRVSVSKMFWIPPDTKFEKKASPWAQIETHLLTVVDENGIPFTLMVNEDKEYEVKLLNFLNRKCQGAVICADGSIRSPFMQGMAPGFRFYGITGSYENDPQIWHVSEKKVKAIAALAELKRRNRYRVAS